MDMQTELSDVMDKLREIRRSLALKSGELAESSKLSLSIKKKEKEIRNLELEIGKLVYERMESLGYFDEVFDELAIRETTRQILKDDPAYFERILKNRLN